MRDDQIKLKLEELVTALKAEGLWKTTEPFWVNQYKANSEISGVDFFEWLQFVYLPNRMLNRQRADYGGQDDSITLQVKQFAGEKLMNQKLVQLLVELDSL